MKRPSIKSLENYASRPVLVFSGSILVLSIALNNIGFKGVIDAWVKSIEHKIEQNPSDIQLKLNELEKRLEKVEHLAHKSGDKQHE
jgi:hypothetical protein